MICPWCQKEMEVGLIQSAREISWLPGEKRRLLVRADLCDGVVLSELSFLKGSAVRAWYCRGCEKLVVDHGDKTTDLNNAE